MAVEITGKAIGLALGGIDEMLERQDAKAVPARTEPLKSWRDYGRIGMVVVGVGTEMFMPRYARMAQTVGEVGAAFLAKSLSKVLFKETTAATAYVHRRQTSPVSNPAPNPVGRNYFPQESQPLNL